MSVIDLTVSTPSLAEVLALAGENNLVLRTREGREFILAEIDDFQNEIDRTQRNPALMQLLTERSKETATFSLKDVRDQLSRTE